MMQFIVIAILMAVVALAWVLPALLRRRTSAATVQGRASNLAILQDQLAELEQDLAARTLPQQQYQQAREDLERRAIEETRDAAPSAAAAPAPAQWTAVALTLLLPLCAAGLYWQFGTPEGLTQAAANHSGAGKVSQQDVEAMVSKLAARLEQTPDDAKGWAMLGRSYLYMRRPDQAVAANERAVSLEKNDADLLADYADALALAQDKRIEGKPLQLLERALKIDPTQWKALAMAGSEAFNRKDYKTAVAYWERLEQRTEPGSDFAREVASNIQEARELGGLKVSANATPAPKAEARPQPMAAGAGVDGSVTLSPGLAGKAAPTDTVFIFARAAEGPRMPLAILRMQVRDLPAKFHLDDSLAMSPAMKLSNFSDVVIGARISKAGSATPQSGDLQGASKPLKVGSAGVKIVIDQVVP
jgi:cytochrome c-type biogenesis protein CcmH